MDIFRIAVIALSFSGLRTISTFDHAWAWEPFVATIAAVSLVKRIPLLVTRPLVWLMLWLLIYFVDGYLLSDASEVPRNLVDTALVTLLPLILLLGAALRDRRQWDRLAVALQLVAIPASAISVAQILSPAVWDYTTRSSVEYNRMTALWMNPNGAAFYFFFAYAMSFWCRVGWLAWGGRVASIVGSVLTFSRGGLFMMAAFSLGYLCATLFISLRHRRLNVAVAVKRLASAAGILTVICCLAAIMPQQPDALLASMSEATSTDGRLTADDVQLGAADRYFLATYWLNEATSAPWYGRGLRYFDNDGFVGEGPHHQFILIYGEVGILGLVTYVLVLGAGLRRTWTTPMSPRDRLILVLTWGGFLFEHFHQHNMFSTRECIVIFSVLFMAPYALRRARPRAVIIPATP
jgi:O-antigen ligase